MGLMSWLGLGKSSVDFLASSANLGINSPWGGGNLTQIVPSEIFGAGIASSLPLSRAEAIRIPAVSKARNLLTGAVAQLPLRALDATGVISPENQPSFLFKTASNVTPYERISWTVDDLIFHGCSLWLAERDAAGLVTAAEWCPFESWRIDGNKLLVDDTEVSEDRVIFINSPFEGLLTVANSTMKGARDIEAAWIARVRNPIPVTVIRHDSGNTDVLEQDEIDDLLAQWSTARRSEDGALGYLPNGLIMDTHGETNPALFVEGRNAIRTDVGSFLNVPTSMLDGTLSEASLTYTTAEGNRNRFYDEALPFWTGPIEARLSMDDVVGEGVRVRFDKAETYALTPTPTGASEQD